MKAPMSSKVRMTPAPLGALELVSIGSNLNSAMAPPIRSSHPSVNLTLLQPRTPMKPFSRRREAVPKQFGYPMRQINKGATMLQAIINVIYREFLRSTFPCLLSEELRR
jgi:hypothetical protein